MPGGRAKTALWVAGGALALVAGALLAAPFLLPAARFLPLLEQQASAALGTSVRIGSLALRPGWGIRAVATQIAVGGGGGPRALEVDRLSAGLRLWPLLRGQVRLSSLRADGVRLTYPFRALKARRPGERPPSAAGEVPVLPVERFDLRDVRVTLLDSSGRRSARGLDIAELSGTLRALPGAQASALGLQFEGEVRLSGLELRAGAGRGARKLGADAVVSLQAGRARVAPLRLRLGEEALEGSVDCLVGQRIEVRGELRSARLDLDRALEALSAPLDVPLPAAPGGGASAPGQPITGTLDLAIDSGRLLGLEFTGARAEAALDKGGLALRSLRVSLYGGGVRGSGFLALGADPLPYRIDAQAEGVDLAGALPALSRNLQGVLSGRFNGNMALGGRGLGGADLSRTLAGSLGLDVRDGRLASVSVLGQVAVLLEAAGGKGIGREHTPFRSLTGDFRVEQGRARTRNLALRSEDLDMDAEGWLGLDASLDFNVDARLSPAVSEAMVAKTSNLRYLRGKDGRLRVRLRMRGPLAAPRVELDPEFVRKTLKRAAEEKGREKIRERLLDLLD